MKESCPTLNKQKGLTLIDLMISVSIFLIIVTIAIPAFNSLLKRNLQRESTQSLIHLINFTRLQAVETGVEAVMCPSADTIECESDWNLPIMVFNDSDGDRARSESEPLLKHLTIVNGRETLSWSSFRDRDYLHFNEEGTTDYQNGTFYYCNGDDTEYKAQVIVSKAGRARVVSNRHLRDRC
ncbi:type IV fimbrial biogenesis protein FimT [Alteromonadaceae bacterium 2753L.S.0a.02]|nr:type IV fimbrial biogenesis protein FimT [Alteromonadaceae bacterium 2753L.S.0a.02]